MMQAPIISDVLQHTGDEPVVPGVYNPIHSRPLLPHERQHHVQRVARPDASSALLPSSVAGRETADGSIDVEDVDPTPYAEAATRVEQMRQRSDRASRMRHAFGQRLMDTAARGGMGRYGDDNDDYDIDEDDYDRGYGFNGDGGGEQGGSGSASTDEYGRLLPLAFPPHAHVVIPRTGESAVDLFFRDLNSRPEAARWRAGGAARTSQRQSSRGQRTRDGSRRRSGSQRPVFPFHPGLIPHHFRRGASGRISPFDFFHSEDIGDLLAFIDANAPAPPPQPPQPPLPALRLTKQQQELAKKDDYTRTVPDANYRDAPRDAAALSSPEAMEIVCTLCEGTLYEKEPAWASSCGHVICNACYGDFSGASKLCSACSKRMVKSRMVHLFS
ncbi:hypothetical protein LPJ75_005317 [Coemansia sp. RSA 2598]|nr:hypothetical protein LPJ75_005317 [Coemansia sp. RSA 2598]